MAFFVIYRDNYVLVDIYFNELKYNRLVQREAFGLLSLLGEVGGFLGLLLGASILTVCEFFDFFIFKVCKAVRKGRRFQQKVSEADEKTEKHP